MINKQSFALRVANSKGSHDFQPIPLDRLEEIAGGGKESPSSGRFRDAFTDGFPQGPIVGPTFVDTFTSSYQPNPE